MTREIKFRIWTGNEHNHRKYGSGEGMIFSSDRICCDWYAILSDHKDYLMQYTGLKDKNGAEIYDGDLLQYKDHIIEVYWGSGIVLVKSKQKKNKEYHDTLAGALHKNEREIIGNKYENPDLLSPIQS